MRTGTETETTTGTWAWLEKSRELRNAGNLGTNCLPPGERLHESAGWYPPPVRTGLAVPDPEAFRKFVREILRAAVGPYNINIPGGNLRGKTRPLPSNPDREFGKRFKSKSLKKSLALVDFAVCNSTSK